MSLTFEFEEFSIYGEWTGDPMAETVMVEVDLFVAERGNPGSMPSLNYPGDPPEPDVFEIETIRMMDVPIGAQEEDPIITLELNETQFAAFFQGGQDVLNNAYEWASEQTIERDDDDQY